MWIYPKDVHYFRTPKRMTNTINSVLEALGEASNSKIF